MKTTTRLAILVGAVSLAALLAGYTVESVENGGSIEGTIRLQGSAPSLPAHTVDDATQHAACGRSVANDAVVTGSGGKLANAVGSIEGIDRGAAVVGRQPQHQRG